MALIKSISGIRGTIGGYSGKGLTPVDVVKFTAAFGSWIKKRTGKQQALMIVGRDARISGPMVNGLVESTLCGLGINVINIGLASTPTVEIAVTEEQADGGIIITASHNPKQWNALKLLNEKGEFITDADGKEVLQIAESEDFCFAEVEMLGKVQTKEHYENIHIAKVLNMPLVDCEAISAAKFVVAIDAVNSVGGIALPPLLRALGVYQIVELYCEPNGDFPHNPEPLPENLSVISKTVVAHSADVGFVVDPDVDRLAIVCNDGSMFGEEYTLVAVADFILTNKKGNTASNLSSTRALRDVTEKHGGSYHSSAVGEVNVVATMKANNAVIGGEGNGGIICPDLHYGRDALVGIALFLTHLAKFGKTCLELRRTYPDFYMSKNKIELSANIDPDVIIRQIENQYKTQSEAKVSTIDGVKVDFADSWFSLRKSNTEPIIRIYTEAKSQTAADDLAKEVIAVIAQLSTT